MLTIGARIGPYDIVSPLGSGGMGEVYLARDTKLGREVAVKILPAAFALDAERAARFRREAQVLASLNHPNIAQIYGLEDIDGVQFLVMELVNGESLDHRLARGAIAVDEALPIAKQIAEALEAAHEKGVIHRDLKPANIAQTKDGQVKVLDFGLAKAIESGASGATGAEVLANSPTITSPAMLSGVGVILGTAAYMSPEQANGRPADKRSDIWAFGCVLYEMLTGRRAFDANDVTDTLATILRTEPAWPELFGAPITVQMTVRRCLEKERRQRFQDVGDVRLALDGAFDIVQRDEPPRMRASVPIALLLAAAIAGAAGWALFPRNSPRPAPATRLSVLLPEGQQLPSFAGTLLALSPDGQTLVYHARGADGVSRLYRRGLGEFVPVPIGEPESRSPAFSPDGRWLAYDAGDHTLKRMQINGGPSQVVAIMPALIRGIDWGPDDNIIVGLFSTTDGLIKVPASGGIPTRLTTPKPGRMHWYPQVLPGGNAVLYTSSSPTFTGGDLEVVDLRSGTSRSLLPGSGGRLLPTGHIVFVRNSTLWAVAFDVEKLRVAGPPAPVVEGIRVESAGAIQLTVAADGTLAYVPGGNADASRLASVDRAGREQALAAPARPYLSARISPDGTRIAAAIADHKQDIWIWDTARQTLTRLTFDGVNSSPAWSPDGRRIIFSSARDGAPNPYWQAADGTGEPERLVNDPRLVDGYSFSPDGKRVVVHVVSDATGSDIGMLTFDGPPRITPLIATRFNESDPAVSPDGRWLAYTSNESGDSQVYVRPFPNVESGRWQVSSTGGYSPTWSKTGQELAFRYGPAIWSVHVKPGSAFSFTMPQQIVPLPAGVVPGVSFDITADGGKFMFVERGGPAPVRDEIDVVLHWFTELQARVAAK